MYLRNSRLLYIYNSTRLLVSFCWYLAKILHSVISLPFELLNFPAIFSDGPLFEVKIQDAVTYPPVPVRSHQAWNTTSTYPAYNQSTNESSHLPYLPVPHVPTSQSFTDSTGTATNLPYPPPMPHGQIYLDPKVVVGVR